MKFIQLFFFSLITVTAFAELEVTSVKIKQNWPWSHKVYIDCTISGVEERVDLSIKAYNGGKEISLPEDAITGPRYCLENDGTYRLTLDPIVAFGKGTKWMSSFKVDVTVAPSSEKSKEIFYKIFDFETKFHLFTSFFDTLLSGIYTNIIGCDMWDKLCKGCKKVRNEHFSYTRISKKGGV